MARDREAQLRRPGHRRRRRRAARGDRGARGRACASRSSASRCSARRTPSWPRAACAAAMGNVNSNDNWQVHFRDTMRGGKFLNNWRMAELHAKEAPDRVWELETYGALFDRTKDGKISQRNFGGHEYPRLAHVGDRTGLELIRTHAAEDRLAAAGRREEEGPAPAPTRQAQGVRRVHDHRAAHATRRARSPARSATTARPATSCCSRRPRSCSPPAASASRSRSPPTRGSAPATAWRSRCAPARRC